MAIFISAELIKKIADHHDANPTDYRDFSSEDGLTLATKAGGFVKDVVREHVRLAHRVSDVIDTLGVVGISEAKLAIGDGTRYVIVYIK